MRKNATSRKTTRSKSKSAPKRTTRKSTSKRTTGKAASRKSTAKSSPAPRKTKSVPRKTAASGGKASGRAAAKKSPTVAEEITARIENVRGLKTGSARVKQLGAILMETLDRVQMKDLSMVAIEELGKTNHLKAIETLSFAWNNCQNVETRSCMVQALSSFPHKEVLKPLERIALSPSARNDLRLQAVEALGRHRTNASWTSLGRILRESSETGDKPLQSAAIEALRSNPEKAVPPLMKALTSSDEDEQVSAATALGVTSDRTALPPLKVLSGRSDSPAVREAATRSAILLYCC